MKVKLIPDKKINPKNEEVLGVVHEPSKTFFDFVFRDNKDMFFDLNAKTLRGECVCDVLVSMEEQNMYIMQIKEFIFVFSNIYEEIDFEFPLRKLQNKVRDKKKEARKVRYFFTTDEFKVLQNILKLKNVNELTEKHEKDFHKIKIKKKKV